MFLQHPLWLALYLELLFHHSMDQPACIYFHVISLCAEPTAWRHLPGAQQLRPRHVLQPVDPTEMRAGTLVPSLLVNKDITVLK